MQNDRWFRALACGFLLMAGVGLAPHASAQSGTPEAGAEIVTAEDCVVEPRSADALRALFREVAATPLPDDLAATPAPMPAGNPADEATVDAVSSLWHEVVACLSANDQPRLFALYSDAMVRRQLQVDLAFGVTEDALIAYLEATPVPISDAEDLVVDPLTDVQLHSDGRVSALKSGDAGRNEALVFIQHDGRWLLDAWYEVG